MEYPKKFSVCPNCGSMIRIIESEAKEQESKGNLKVGAKMACLALQNAIFDPVKAGLIAPREFPMIISFFDICADCGTLYCVEVQKAPGKAQPQVRRDDHNKGFPI